MTLEKILIGLMSLMALVIIVLIIKLIRQRKMTSTAELERDTIINLFQALSGYQNKNLSLDLINETPESYLRYFGANIMIYYEGLIRELSFEKLAYLVYELENSVTNFQKKRQLLEHFSRAAAKISTLFWAKLLMSSITEPTFSISINRQEYIAQAKRLERFIIVTAKTNQRLLLLEGDLKDELARVGNKIDLAKIKQVGEMLERIREALK